jgi:hypothetical protein
MQAARGFTYQGSIDVSGSATQILGQFAAPDSDHLVVTAANGSKTELLFVNGRSFVKKAAGSWSSDKFNGSTSLSDPRSLFAVLDQATDVTSRSAANGDVYTFVLPPTAASALFPGSTAPVVEGTATVHDGDLAVLVLRMTRSGVSATTSISYAAIGSIPALPQPPPS